MTAPQTPCAQNDVSTFPHEDISADTAVVAPLPVRSFGCTDCGKVRDRNEDHFLIAVLMKAMQVVQTSLPQPKIRRSSDMGYLFVVADGMGGRSGGETASALAIGSVESFTLESLKWFAECKGDEQDKVLADFQQALTDASSRIQTIGSMRPELMGMGTTLTLAYCLNRELFVAHAGDSRCYLCRKATMYRLTRDHTLMEELIRAGRITTEEAKTHKLRHVITNALGGGGPPVAVEVHKLQLEPGDILLLCSDGLTEMLPDETISEILHAEPDPEKSCRELVAHANQAGGRDNITAVVVHFGDALPEKARKTVVNPLAPELADTLDQSAAE
jgi:serine/threonine protein phosphatase PrpC